MTHVLLRVSIRQSNYPITRSSNYQIRRCVISFSMAARSVFASASVARIVSVGADIVPVRAPEPTNAVMRPFSRERRLIAFALWLSVGRGASAAVSGSPALNGAAWPFRDDGPVRQ